MTGRYDEMFRRSLADPEGFWGEAAEAIDWERRWDRVLDDSRAPFTLWFAGGRLNTCWNALDRHVERGRGEQAGADLRQPRHRHDRRRSPTAQLRDEVARLAGALAGARRRQGRPRPHLHADGAGGGDGDARLRAHRRHPLRGVRRLRGARARDPHRRRQAQGDPLGLLRHRGRSGSFPTSRCSTPAIELATAKPAALRHPAAAAGARPTLVRGPRPRLGGARRRRRSPRPACRSRRPIRSTSSTPPAPPAFPRASCATMAATRWRCTGR